MLNFITLQTTEGFLAPPAGPTPPSHFLATESKLDSFAALPNGWHYGAGVTPSEATIQNAHEWHRRFAQSGFLTTDAFPGAGGEIMVTAYRDEHFLEIVVETDNTVSFYHERGDETITSLPHKLSNEVEDAIETAAGILWSTSDYSTTEILTPERIDSTAWRLRTSAVAAPSFRAIALCAPERPYAPISVNITRTSPGNPLFFGYSPSPSSHPAAH